MINQLPYSIPTRRNENLIIKLARFEEDFFSGQIQRYDCFTLIWITSGPGKIKTGFSEYEFQENSLFAFSPFQPFLFTADNSIKGIVIHFCPEYVFNHQNDKEINFKKVLYNNIHQAPFVKLDASVTAVLNMLCEKIETETQIASLAQHELLAAYLKIFLITASRLKMEQQPQLNDTGEENKEHRILQKLQDAIEENFRAKHSPCDYATMLFVTTKTLARVSKSYYNRTISDIINERIIIEAKSELYLTDKPVKRIAYELGYEDEYYFSRFFKINTKVSPQKYRETVGCARA